MAVLEKIRVKMGVFITLIIAVALLSFIIDPGTLQSAVSMFSSKYDVGEMNGSSITYQEYQKRIDYFTKIFQLTSGSQTMSEENQDYINQSAWQDLLTENVLLPVIDNAGVKVGDDEMVDLSQGSSISPVLLRERSFMGEDGQFDRTKLVGFIKQIPQDNSGNLATYWKYLESNIKNEQIFTKYISLLTKSSIYNPVELRRTIEENNVTSDVSFVMQPYSFAPDSTIAVTKQEIKDYYNKNKKLFEQKASRDIEYVVFEVVPSERDLELAKTSIDNVFKEFSTTDNLKNFLAKNSDKPLDTYYYKSEELASVSPILDSFAFKSPVSSVLPVFLQGNTYMAARVNSVKQMSDSVFVQHILIQDADKAVAQAKADSLMKVLAAGGDFSALAAQYSADKNPNALPGDIGWMTQQRLIPGFESCFDLAPGKLTTLETNYGLHIVKVKEKTKPMTKVQLALLVKEAVAGKETFQKFYSTANDLATKSDGKIEKFNAAVKEMNLTPIPATGIEAGAKTVATYKNAREISRWAYEAKVGDVSQIIAVDNKYFFVAALTAANEEGIPELSAVEKKIADIVRKEKSDEKAVAEVSEKIKGLATMDEIAAKLGTTVSKQAGISFGAPGSQSFDPKFIGAIAGADVNKLTGPMGGNVGVYVFNVDARQTGAFFTEDDAKARNNQILSFKVQMLSPILEKSAMVKDNRAKFF
ncbi:MAG: SurA N-terminal domain-containing protein [Bacteroidales bacterium]|nr:SurA N-terminal domain-containing protein [Bacteroidales bacterium]